MAKSSKVCSWLDAFAIEGTNPFVKEQFARKLQRLAEMELEEELCSKQESAISSGMDDGSRSKQGNEQNCGTDGGVGAGACNLSDEGLDVAAAGVNENSREHVEHTERRLPERLCCGGEDNDHRVVPANFATVVQDTNLNRYVDALGGRIECTQIVPASAERTQVVENENVQLVRTVRAKHVGGNCNAARVENEEALVVAEDLSPTPPSDAKMSVHTWLLDLDEAAHDSRNKSSVPTFRSAYIFFNPHPNKSSTSYTTRVDKPPKRAMKMMDPRRVLIPSSAAKPRNLTIRRRSCYEVWKLHRGVGRSEREGVSLD